MKIYTFIYIISNLIILQLISLDSQLVNDVVYGICAFGIVTLGIAHGSLDNILFESKTKKSDRSFYIRYILLILIFIVLWATLADVALLLFLIISAYHFGQSQFEEYGFHPPYFSKVYYFLWGGLVLTLPLIFHSSELLSISEDYVGLVPLAQYVILYASEIMIGLLVPLVFMTFVLIRKNDFDLNEVWKQVYIFALIIVSFMMLPPFIAFSLFFVFIHSLKVIIQEYRYCKNLSKVDTWNEFVKICLPLTTLSIVGICFLMVTLYYLDQLALLPFALIVVLSAITFPHSIVMERFYSYMK